MWRYLVYFWGVFSACFFPTLQSLGGLIHELSRGYQATGEDFSVEPAESRRPFRALLDVGLIRTTTGNRVFGALKVQ